MVDRYMDGYGSEDMATPELKLVQSVGGEFAKALGAKPGDFYIGLNDEIIPGETEGLDIVIADILKTRTYWGRSDIDADPPECASFDARSMRSTGGEDCSICDKRTEMPGLIEDPSERRKRCTPGYSILAIRADADRMPILIRAHGINATPARELITSLRINRQVKGAYEKVLVHLTSTKQKTASGEAYSFSFKPKAIIPDNKAREFLLQTEQLLGTGRLLEEAGETKPALPEAEETKAVKASETLTTKEEAPVEIPKEKVKVTKELPIVDLDF